MRIGEEIILKVESRGPQVVAFEHAVKNAQDLVRRYNKKNISLTNILFRARKKNHEELS